MRMFFILATLLIFEKTTTTAQDEFVGQDFSDYYEWFDERSQTELLYRNNATLYIFSDNTEVHLGPCQDSKVLATLPIGQGVTNIAYEDYYLPEDEINGYGDFWYQVKIVDPEGTPIHGYVWGADIAKAWQEAELTGDTQEEFILLGIASKTRRQPTDINAEIRVLHHGKLLYQKLVPGLCVFEECAAEAMLRVLEVPQHQFKIIEASTMTIGCWAGIEKAYFYWNGSNLQRVYQAEYTTKKEFANQAFSVTNGRNDRGEPVALQVCHFSHEDENYDPVWKCRVIQAAPVEKEKAVAAVTPSAR